MFCRKYHCKAENPHGVAFHDIELEEAHEPGELQQAILDKSTATTLQFRYLATSTTTTTTSQSHHTFVSVYPLQLYLT